MLLHGCLPLLLLRANDEEMPFTTSMLAELGHRMINKRA